MKEREKETDGEILRQKQNVHVCVWSHVPKCVFIECQKKKKKTGTMDMTPSVKRSRPKKNKKTGDDVPEKKKNKGMKIRQKWHHRKKKEHLK